MNSFWWRIWIFPFLYPLRRALWLLGNARAPRWLIAIRRWNRNRSGFPSGCRCRQPACVWTSTFFGRSRAWCSECYEARPAARLLVVLLVLLFGAAALIGLNGCGGFDPGASLPSAQQAAGATPLRCLAIQPGDGLDSAAWAVFGTGINGATTPLGPPLACEPRNVSCNWACLLPDRTVRCAIDSVGGPTIPCAECAQ